MESEIEFESGLAKKAPVPREHRDQEGRRIAEFEFLKRLEERCDPYVREFIRKNRMAEDSLLMLRHHDEGTFLHSLETANIAGFLADDVESLREEKENLVAAAIFHDYGKLAIDPELLNKNGNLSEDDKESLKKHVSYGFELLRDVNELWAKMVVAHHENQKSPYPRSKPEDAGEERRIFDERAKRLTNILSMIDSYEAMLAERPGNPPLPVVEAMRQLSARFVREEERMALSSLHDYHIMKHPEEPIDAVSN